MDHLRSDEGMERGPRQPPAPWPTRKPPTSGKLGPNFDAMQVVQRYLEGEEISQIADTLGVHPKALNYHLLKPQVLDAWREAQVAVSLAEYQEAKEVVRGAPDALSLARAREQLRSSQWDLERLFSRLFGPHQTITVEHIGDLGDKLRRARERVIEGEVVRESVAAIPSPQCSTGEITPVAESE